LTVRKYILFDITVKHFVLASFDSFPIVIKKIKNANKNEKFNDLGDLGEVKVSR